MINTDINTLTAQIEAIRVPGQRQLIALAGAPGSGKSTLAHRLADALGEQACVLPMDGFHHSNAWLDARQLRPRKGAPNTFDVDALDRLLAQARIKHDLTIPTFDRTCDAVVIDGGRIPPSCDWVVVEGNYLLAQAAPWQALRRHFDLAVYLDVPINELERRLTQRWLDLGMGLETARAKVEGNDLPNAAWVIEHTHTADYRISGADSSF